MLVASSMPIRPTRVADEPGVSGPEVPILYDSSGDGSSGVGLIEEPAKSLDGSDSDDSLSNLRDQDEGVFDLGLREGLESLLSYLRSR